MHSLEELEIKLQKALEIESQFIKGSLKEFEALRTLETDFEVTSHHEGIIAANCALSIYHKLKTDFKKSLDCLKKAEKSAKKLNSKSSLGKIYGYMGGVHTRLGDRKQMSDCYLASMDIFDELNLPSKKGATLLNFGMAYLALKELTQAEKYLLQANTTYENLEDKSQNWIVTRGLAEYYIEIEKWAEAEKFANKTLEFAEESDHEIAKQFAFRALSKIESSRGEFNLALDYLNRALAIVDAHKIMNIRDSLVISIGSVHTKMGNTAKAKEIIFEVLDNINQERFKSFAHEYLHDAFLKEGNFKEALFHIRKKEEIKEKTEGQETKQHLELTEAKYQNKLKESEKKILALQKVEWEQKAIRAQLNPHFFFNSLNSIQKFIVEHDTKNASKFLLKFGGLMRKTLENSEEQFITVEDEILFLTDYLDLEQMRFNNSFQFKFEIHKDVEQEMCSIPTMLLQPYVENCIKHGINGIENGLIMVSFEPADNGRIKCAVQDNGKGRANSKGSEHKSMGTKLLEERLVALQEQYKLACSIETIDLIDESKTPNGTRVEVTVPDMQLIT